MFLSTYLVHYTFEDDFNHRQVAIRKLREEAAKTVSQKRSEDSSGNGLGLFSISGSSYNAADAEADQEMAKILQKKKKKAKRKRGIRL